MIILLLHLRVLCCHLVALIHSEPLQKSPAYLRIYYSSDFITLLCVSASTIFSQDVQNKRNISSQSHELELLTVCQNRSVFGD